MSDFTNLSLEIRGVLIPVHGGRLLLPNAVVSEVITFSDPEPVEGAPDWLLGRVNWRGWHLPLVAYSRLVGLPREERALNSRVSVLKVFGGNPRMPYLALVTQGFPRLTTISRDILVAVEQDEETPVGVWGRVHVRDEVAVIPDLQAIEDQVTQALAQANAA